MPEYEFNSEEKKYIRSKWVEFAKRLSPTPSSEFTMITLTTESLDDFRIFAENGFFQYAEQETGLLNITKGKIFCFEHDGSTRVKLINKLPNNAVICGEVCHEIGKQYNLIFTDLHKSNYFPSDVINLDFNSSIFTATKRDITTVFKWIFEIQKKYNKDFSLFLTFANTSAETQTELLSSFSNIIEENLSNTLTEFKSNFEKNYSSVTSLKSASFDNFLKISLAKFLVKHGAHNKFKLCDSEYFVYPKTNHKMISLLFNFKYAVDVIHPIDIYKNDCVKCLNELKELNLNNPTPQVHN